jgi:hypothetical protein
LIVRRVGQSWEDQLHRIDGYIWSGERRRRWLLGHVEDWLRADVDKLVSLKLDDFVLRGV